MKLNRILIYTLQTLFIIVSYVLASKLGFFLAFLNSQVSPIWPPEGVAFTSLMLLGRKAFFPVFLGALTANYLNNPHIPTALLIGIGNSLGALINSEIFRRISKQTLPLENTKTMLQFLFFCTVVGSTVSALVGVTSLWFFNFVPSIVYWNVVITWFSGEMQGYIITAPFLLTLFLDFPNYKWNPKKIMEGLGILILLILISYLAFFTKLDLSFLPIPIALLATIRFRRLGAVFSIIIISFFSVYRTSTGVGPFAVLENGKVMVNNSLIILDVFILAITITIYYLATMMEERLHTIEITEEQVKTRTKELRKALDVLNKDILTASRIQEKIIPEEHLELPNLKIDSIYHPLDGIGGDFFDVYQLSENKYRFFIADATGHGVQAAMITMVIKSEYENLKIFDSKPSKIIQNLNAIFCNKYRNLEIYFTCALADVDIEKNEVIFSTAGHPYQILAKNSGKIHFLKVKCVLLGYKEDRIYNDETFPFEKGDKLYLFTDGIFEEFNEKTQEFGEYRFYKYLEKNRTQSFSKFSSGLLHEVRSFIAPKTFQDDMTLIQIERT